MYQVEGLGGSASDVAEVGAHGGAQHRVGLLLRCQVESHPEEGLQMAQGEDGVRCEAPKPNLNHLLRPHRRQEQQQALRNAAAQPRLHN